MTLKWPVAPLIAFLLAAAVLLPEVSAVMVIPGTPAPTPAAPQQAIRCLPVPTGTFTICPVSWEPAIKNLFGLFRQSPFAPPLPGASPLYRPVTGPSGGAASPVSPVPGVTVIPPQSGTGLIEGTGTILIDSEGNYVIRSANGVEYRIGNVSSQGGLFEDGSRVWFHLRKNTVLLPGSTSPYSVIALYHLGDGPLHVTGTVRYIELEGGFYGIIADDGTEYYPLDLPAALKHDRLRITFTAHPVLDYVSIQMWGKPVVLDGSARIVQESDILVTFTRTGGFAGMNDTLTVYTDGSYTVNGRFSGSVTGDLSPGEVSDLKRILTNAFAQTSGSEFRGAPGSADLFLYTVIFGGRTIRAEETAVPSSLETVINEFLAILGNLPVDQEPAWDGVLAGTCWNITRLPDSTGALLPVMSGTDPFITFGADGNLSFRAGCTGYTARYIAGDESLRVAGIITDGRYCPTPYGVIEQGETIAGALTRARTYSVRASKVMLVSGEDYTPLMELAYAGRDMASPVKIGPTPGSPVPETLRGTKWGVVGVVGEEGDFVGPIAGTEPFLVFGASGSVYGNAGCNSFSGSYTEKDGSLAVGPLMTTLMYCASPAGVMDQEMAVTKALSGASTYTFAEMGTLLVNGSDGATLLELRYIGAEEVSATDDTLAGGSAREDTAVDSIIEGTTTDSQNSGNTRG